MKSQVGSMLHRGGWQAYEAWLLSRICELMDRAREGAFGSISGGVLKQGLARLEVLDAVDLLREGTPFFWMNVHKLYRTREPAGQAQAIRGLLMTGFDSYFHLMRDGDCVAIPDAERQSLILPRLGIAIPDVSQVLLRRLSCQALEVEAATNRLTIDLTQPSHKWRASTCKVFKESPETVIASADPALTTPETTETVSDADVQPFSARIARALTLIDSIDSELNGSIRKLIHWFVPLKMPSLSLHYSHSARDMIGVVHLSEGYSGIRLCEAIVHEYHHNELFALEATQKLADHDQKAIFYSPWRSDPRPLSGLFHALHVFSAVVRFYRMAESMTGADIDRGEVHQRRSEFCQKLRIGMSQVPQRTLTSLGKRFLQAIEDDLIRQERELQLRSGRVSDANLTHARTWCRVNPACVQHLYWPGGVRKLIG